MEIRNSICKVAGIKSQEVVVTIILITTKEGSRKKGEGGLSKENIKLFCTCAAFHKSLS